MKETSINENWFGEILNMFVPNDYNIDGKNIKQIINSATTKAFSISFAAAIHPGLFGWATLLPELIMITKVQINLIYSVAKYHNQQKRLTPLLIAMIFGTGLGIELGKGILKKAGAKIVISKVSQELIEPIMKKISVKLLSRIMTKIPSRWIPFITAPIFGSWSATNTKAIGYAADKIFSQTIEYEN